MHTYIHNWPLQPFSQDYGLASHTIHVVSVNFILEWQDLQFNVDFERAIFEKLFKANLFTLGVFARNLLREIRRRNIFFHFSFSCLTWYTNPSFTSNKPTHYLLDYGDFRSAVIFVKRKSPKEIFSHISLCVRCLSWGSNHMLSSNRPTYFLLDYGYFHNAKQNPYY